MFDRTTPQEVTVTINRDNNWVKMRAAYDREVYEIPLETAVTIIIQHLSRVRAEEKRTRRRTKVKRGILAFTNDRR